MTERACVCGHPDDGFYMCIDGFIYGPCEYEHCGGICTDIAECGYRPGCCDWDSEHL